MLGGRTPDQLRPSAAPGLAALLGTDDAGAPGAARDLVRAAVGLEAETVAIEPVPYASGSPTTGGLCRLRATAADGSTASLFCKLLQHVRHWPALSLMPPHLAEQFAAELPWRVEMELWDPLVQQSLPVGLRSPQLHRVVDLGDDRIAVWQEDVVAVEDPWDLEDFATAARLLGRWNARCAQPDLLATSSYPAGFALRMYAERSVPFRGLAPLEDDELWAHPWLRDHADLRAGLRRLGRQLPAVLDRLDRLPQTLPHGDASPQNLLRPADRSADLVVIDLSFRAPHAIGFDLGQLLVGLVHAGELPAAELPTVAAVIEPAYRDGVRDAGLDVSAEVVSEGFRTAALVRSGFDSLLYGLLERSDPADRPAFDERLALSRFLAQQRGGISAPVAGS